MKGSNRLVLFGALGFCLLGLIAAGLAWFFHTFERAERQTRDRPSVEVRRNPYLALDYLLNDLGHPTATVHQLDAPYPGETLVMLLGDEHAMRPDAVWQWVRWVEQGHHLVLVQPKEARDTTLEALGFRFGTPPRPAPAEEPPEGDPAPPDVQAMSPAHHTYSDVWHWAHLRWTASDIDWVAALPRGSVLAVSRRHENGRVTVLAGAEMFENRRIGKGQTATLVHDLVMLGEPPDGEAEVTIVQFGRRVSWVMHVATTFWPTLLVLAIALLLGLKIGRAPFGPRLEPPPADRRSRAEHIAAMGRFLWRFDASRVLVEATREALVRQLARRRPAIATLRGAERAALVAEELGISPEEAHRLLDAPAPARSQHFFDLIHTLENHRRSL